MEKIEEFLNKLKELINKKCDYQCKTISGKPYMGGNQVLNKPVAFLCYYSSQKKSIGISLESQLKSGFIIINDLYEMKKDELEKLGYNVDISIGSKNKNWVRLKLYKEVNQENLLDYVDELSEVFIKYKDIVEDYILNKNNTWIFQGNPRIFDVDTYIKENKVVTWDIRQERFADKIKNNDEVYIWRSNGKQAGGIVAYGKVIKETYLDDENDKVVDIEILEYRLTKEDGMLLRDDLKNDVVMSSLSIIRQPNATNFEINEEQSDYLSKLWNKEISYDCIGGNMDTSYFYEFKEVADKWFDKNKSWLEENYNFFSKFKQKEFLETLKWEDVQALGDHINAFRMAILKKQALGQPNHEIEHYRNSFIYLIYGEDDLKIKIDAFKNDDRYKIERFGESVISELVGYLFSDELCLANQRDKFALEKILNVKVDYKRGDSYGEKYIKFNDAIKSNKIPQLYLDIVGKKTDLPLYYEIDQFFSYLYETYKDQKSIKYWSISAGENSLLWNEFLNESEIRIGWDYLGDLTKYKTKDEIAEKIKEHTGTNNHYNDVLANYEFVSKMQIGDKVIAKKGNKEIIGVGTVTSDYIYDDDKISYKHVRKVEWNKIGNWTLEGNDKFHQKTLTDITKYPEFVDEIMKLVNGEDIPPVIKYKIEDILKDVFIEQSKIENIITTLNYKKNIILQGPPGVGKTFVAKKLCYLHQGYKCDEQIEIVQFHQSYSYEDFIRGYRPNSKGGFSLKDGVFYKFVQKAIANSYKNYYFIIDEINRGNLSKIFGELMMLIEKDKRGEGYKLSLTYQENDEKFYIPENLYIIGTMNTADRSLAMVDYALRRRFSFIDIEPAFDNQVLKSHFEKYLGEEMTSKIITRINRLNKEIEKDSLDLGKGYRIGHSYFTPTEEIDDVNIWYRNIIKMEIEPLIREYWFDRSEDEIQPKVDDLLAD